MSLVRAERRRFLKRRMIVWSLVILIGLLTTIASIIFFTTKTITPEVRAQAAVTAESRFREAVAINERCKQDPARNECERSHWGGQEPRREFFQPEDYLPPTFNFRNEAEDLVATWAALFAMFAFMIGASFVGAEWRSGAMMNLLTWRPKRMQVLGTKLGVLLGWLIAIGAAMFGAWTAALAGTASVHGSMEGMTSSAWQSYLLTGLRGMAMVLAFAAIGFGLASIGRHIGLALGVALGVIVVGQFGLSAVLFLARVPYPELYLIPTHMQAWLEKSTEVYDPFDQAANPIILSFGESGSIGLGVVFIVLVAAFFLMRRRDIAD